MRVIVFFDLPSVTDADKRAYRDFRKSLIRAGFMMIQESVYTKLALNSTSVQIIASEIRAIKPEKGFVLLLTVTEKQFSRMEIISGENACDVVNSDERLIVL